MTATRVAAPSPAPRISDLQTLHAIGATLNGATDLKEALERSLRMLIDVMGLGTGWIFLFGPHKRFQTGAHYGLPPALAVDAAHPIKFGGCECQTLFRKGRLTEPVNMVKCSRLEKAVGDKRGLTYHASVPLRGQSRLLGILNVAVAGVERFTAEDLELLGAVGNLVGVAVERARLYSELQERNALLADLLTRYVAEPVAAQALQFPRQATGLGGKRRLVSVLFCDIRGFVPLAEALEPEQVMEILNGYFGALVEVLYRHNGVLIEYTGDGMEAVFGAAAGQTGHAASAVRAALEMQQVVGRLEVPGHPGVTLRMGVGVHTGEAVVGNVGSARRMKYAVVGDAVNLAARLHEHAGPGQILITAETFRRVRGHVNTHPLGALRMKGKQEWVHAHAVLELRPRAVRRLGRAARGPSARRSAAPRPSSGH